jgi:gluconolactonase
LSNYFTMKKSVLLLILVVTLSVNSPAQDQALIAIIADGAKLEKIAEGFSFSEGPTADKKGNVYFTDQPNNRILVWNEKSGISTFMEPCGRSNGMAFDRKGNLWTCADDKGELWLITPQKKVKKITGSFNGNRYNGPNDVWAAPDGGLYFSDPFFVRSYWEHKTMTQDKQCVYYLKPDHKTVIRVAEDLLQPNGVIGTPDGKTLYIADMQGRKTFSYTINPDGTLSDKKLFCEMGSDGLTIDMDGNLYLVGRGVTVFDKSGKKIGNIPVPEGWTANVCFGDKDFKSLFITASKGLYRIRMKVKGATTN